MCVSVKPAGAAAVSGVEDAGVRHSASGADGAHTPRPPGPHTPVLRPRHPAAVQRVHTEGAQSVEAAPYVHFDVGICRDVFLVFQSKGNAERERQVEETQQMIRGCPVQTLLPLSSLSHTL